jgi:hypothetical protein
MSFLDGACGSGGNSGAGVTSRMRARSCRIKRRRHGETGMTGRCRLRRRHLTRSCPNGTQAQAPPCHRGRSTAATGAIPSSQPVRGIAEMRVNPAVQLSPGPASRRRPGSVR